MKWKKEDEIHEKISLSKMAEEIGIDKSTLFKYLNDKAECGINNLCKIADYFGVTTDYLLGRTKAYSSDTNMQNACDYIGLNQRVVERIQSLSKSEKYILSSLILHFETRRAFSDVSEWYVKARAYNILKNKAETEIETDTESAFEGIAIGIILPDEINFCEYKAINQIKSVLAIIAEESNIPIPDSVIQQEISNAISKAKQLYEREVK